MTDKQIEKLIDKIDKHNEASIDSKNKLIQKIIELTAESCGVDNPDLIKTKTNKEEIVFARNLTMWYIFKHLNYGKTHVGKIVNKDHAMAIRAINIIDDCQNNAGKYLKPYQRVWLQNFNKLIQM